MGRDYIPEQDLRAALWMKQFARVLVEQPEDYRTTPEAAAQVADLVLAFRVALARCWPHSIRSRNTVATKNAARRAAERLVRPESQRIRTDPQIPAPLKLRIGLSPTRKRRRSVPVPQSSPVLMLRTQKSGLVTIQALDSDSGRKARPAEAMGLELYERIVPRAVVDARASLPAADPPSEAPPVAPGESDYAWRFVGIFTGTKMSFHPALREYGDEVSYVARWVGRRGEPGPFGQHKSLRPPMGLRMPMSLSDGSVRAAA